MNKNIISVIDLISINNGHEMFNFSILNELNLSVNEKVNFFSMESNDKIFKRIKKSNIQLIKIKENYSYVFRTIFFFYKNIVLNKSKKIVFLAFDNSLLPLLFLLNFLFLLFQNKKITIILHNNILTYKKNKLKKTIFKIFINIYKPKIIVLAPFIKNEFDQLFSYNNIICCFHQNYKHLLEKNIINLNSSKLLKPKIRVAISSTHSKVFLKHKLYDLIKNEQDDSFFVSYVGEKINYDSKFFVNIERPTNLSDYYKYIKNSDFIFFPIDGDLNSRASGVLIDALSLGVNFIGPKIGHFKDINESFGLGILYENYNELQNIFLNLRNHINPDVDFFIRSTSVNKLIRHF